jgi:hypothetical protein
VRSLHTSKTTDTANRVWGEEEAEGLHEGVLQESTRVPEPPIYLGSGGSIM